MFYMAPGQNLVGFYTNTFYTNGPIELIFLSFGKAGSRGDLNRNSNIYYLIFFSLYININIHLILVLIYGN